MRVGILLVRLRIRQLHLSQLQDREHYHLQSHMLLLLRVLRQHIV